MTGDPCGHDGRHFGYGWAGVACERDPGHPGLHAKIATELNEYGKQQVWTWRHGTGNRFVRDPLIDPWCAVCGTPLQTAGRDCSTCFWSDLMLEDYARGRLIVTPTLFGGEPVLAIYRREPTGGAFANAQITVRMADGTVHGPDSHTWHVGYVPHEHADRMPANATLEWRSR